MTDELLAIDSGPIRIELLPGIGGRIHRLRAFGRDLLRTPSNTGVHAGDPFYWGAYVMAPWCNRLPAEPVAVAGRTVDLPANYRDGTAIHGQVSTVPWTVDGDGSLVVRGGGDGWPWPYEVRQRLTVLDAAVAIELSLTSLADGRMPGGIGLHPWFVKPLELRLAASAVAASNLDPASPREPVAGRFDLRGSAPVPDDVDASWTDLDDPALELRWPDLGIEATLAARSSVALSVAIASPADVDAVAIEPQTHLPGGLRRHLAGDRYGLVSLAPGASVRLAVELRLREVSIPSR
jgi:aldose 1-epimerase